MTNKIKSGKNNNNEIQVTDSFSYKLREVTLSFSLIGMRQLKDFLVLLEKSKIDLEKKIKEKEAELTTK